MACSVCLEKKPNLISCCSCQSLACSSCQTEYGIAACMSCQQEFTEEFLTRTGHEKLVKTVIRPAEETFFWNREKEFLASTQKLVDWEDAIVQLHKQLRFGFKVDFPPKPSELVFAGENSIFPCPSSECRGFVVPSEQKCGSCKRSVCMKCRAVANSNHVCDPLVLETLASLQKDSKPCPKCFAPIFRMSGCNHMFCTNCRTHFDWMSGKILSASTNHHYDNTQAFATNVSTRNVESSEGTDCNSSSTFLRTSFGPIPPLASSNVQRFLWKEPLMIFAFARDHLRLDKVRESHQHGLIKIRMQFLRGVSEAQCKRKVWLLEKALQQKTAEADFVRGFLDEIAKLQVMVRNGQEEQQVLRELEKRVEFYNKLLADVKSKIQFRIHEGPLLNM